MNFLGSAFPRSTYYPSNERFIFKYLAGFPPTHVYGLAPNATTSATVSATAKTASALASAPTSVVRAVTASVTGEASPDYLVSGLHAVVNALRFVPRARIVVSLREPGDRAASAYANKLADETLHKMLNPIMFGTVRADSRLDSEVGRGCCAVHVHMFCVSTCVI